MILSKLIVEWLEWIIEIGIWVLLIASFASGISMGDGFFGSIFTGLVSVVIGGVFCALMFGFFLVLNDIRRLLREAIDSNGSTESESTPSA